MPSPLLPKWKKEFAELLRDRRVKLLLEKNSVIAEVIGKYKIHFIVVDIFYGKYAVIIDHNGYNELCDVRCEGFSRYGRCYHINACRAYLLKHKLLKEGCDIEKVLYEERRGNTVASRTQKLGKHSEDARTKPRVPTLGAKRSLQGR